MSWVFINHTKGVKLSKFNELTKIIIQLILWQKLKHHQFWKFWLIAIKSISTQFNKLNDWIKIKCQKKKLNQSKKTIWLIKLILKNFFKKLCFRFNNQKLSKLNIIMKTCWKKNFQKSFFILKKFSTINH